MLINCSKQLKVNTFLVVGQGQEAVKHIVMLLEVMKSMLLRNANKEVVKLVFRAE